MLNTIRIFAIASLSTLALASLSGCALDSASGDDTSSSEADVTAKKYHYAPTVDSVSWNAGCGPVHPSGATCATPKIVIDYTPSYIDLKETHTVKIDNRKMTITIKLDTWSTSQIHSHVYPMPVELDIDEPSTSGLTPGGLYTVNVDAYDGTCVFTTQIRIMLPA